MRPDWDTYFAQLIDLVKTRSTCLRAHHGALIVKDNRILASGYNGAPSLYPHCLDKKECFRTKNNIPSGEQYEKCKALHAEQNALLQCAKYGISVIGASIYISDVPCEICAKMIANSGIVEVVIIHDSGRYKIDSLYDLVKACGTVRTLSGR